MPSPVVRSQPLVRQLGVIWLLAGLTGACQAEPSAPSPGDEPVDLGLIERLRDEGLNRSRVPEDLRYLADVIGPRLTGSPAMEAANAWTAEKMREYGLADVHLEEYDFGRGWEELSYRGRMTTPFVMPLHGRSVAWAGRTEGPQAGPAVFVDERAAGDLEPLADRLRGAWVLVDPAGSDWSFRSGDAPARWSDDEVLTRDVEVARTREERSVDAERYRAIFDVRQRLARMGVLGIVHRSRFTGGTLGWVESIIGEEIPPEVLMPGGIDPLPNVMLTDAEYSLIYRNLQAEVPVALEFDLQTRFIDDDPRAYNTIGEIPGTDLRDEVVIIGAHLDSWTAGTGALDNGVGSIVALEAMRLLAAAGAAPRRTIRVGLWSGEEPEDLYHDGLFGSQAYVKAHAQELDRTSAYLNLDAGSGRIRGIWEQFHPEAASVIAAIMRPLGDLGVVGLKPGYFVGSDDKTFEAAGVPSFPFVHDVLDSSVYHTEADTYDRAALDDLRQASVVVAVVAYHLATREDRLPRRQ